VTKRTSRRTRQLGLPLASASGDMRVPVGQKEELVGALKELLVRFAETVEFGEEESDEALIKIDG